jgi:hypothetical protein
MYRVTRIGIGSAFRIGAAMMGALWLVLGTLLIFLPADVLNSGTSYSNSGYSDTSQIDPIFLLVCGFPIYLIIGGLMGAFSAFVYNLIAPRIGGLEVEFEVYEKPQYIYQPKPKDQIMYQSEDERDLTDPS